MYVTRTVTQWFVTSQQGPLYDTTQDSHPNISLSYASARPEMIGMIDRIPTVEVHHLCLSLQLLNHRGIFEIGYSSVHRWYGIGAIGVDWLCDGVTPNEEDLTVFGSSRYSLDLRGKD